MTFLETAHGKPHTVKGLGNWFADRCKEAGVPGRAHGLRKAGATLAAQNGATPHQLMAIFGWKTLSQAELYTKAVQQQLMAGGAMNLLAAENIAGDAQHDLWALNSDSEYQEDSSITETGLVVHAEAKPGR
ncbi:hypothetical protein JQ554_27120 [Bradyrhizobium diazoefficiens]|nr:hypothetical protein [Bradyrhizobium diazoefficiens]UCF52224.1 MAG: hypothetical protein JSV48_23655 [Bradyrhizobium sp.]MBR0967913.1 hypothetical protein [Bradyrhizobium diazoefficiens]MBR0981310.1 hypothetical protein [Bradyrhizobium diazoefficiens]MBR1010764.1 hypothetical protein [Bradyrhizobium diazoefficiens]MBR1017275.1 hypothetical protein [Bradyrhizobium diazoefficiens]